MRSLHVLIFCFALMQPLTAGGENLPEIARPDSDATLAIRSLGLEVAGNQLTLSWQPVIGAISYTVHSSPLPQGPFEPDLTGSYSATAWTAPLASGRRFYYVTWNDTFVAVAGGSFFNGTGEVTLSPYMIDKYELTQGAYFAVMGTNTSYGFGLSDDRPVYNASWFNAVEFCNRLSMQNSLTPCYSYSSYGTDPSDWPPEWDDSWSSPPYNNHQNFACDWTANGYRLPTDMEWEFAARGGNLSQGFAYSGSNILNEVGWYNGNASYLVHVVGTKAPNELGLYDLSGNVGEWAWDIWTALPTTPQTDPHGGTTGNYRTFRNGYFNSPASSCTVSYRAYSRASTYSAGTGFRVCRRAP